MSAYHLSTDTIISACALFISLLALVYSIYEGRLARKHNRLSVKPFLDFSLFYSGAQPKHYLALENKGLGPAKITGFVLLADGKTNVELGISDWASFCKYLGFTKQLNWTYIEETHIMLPGEKIELISYATNTYDSAIALQFKNAIKRITVTVQYVSLYENEKFETAFVGKVLP